MPQKYEYNGEVFEVFEPENCRIAVAGKGLTGEITIHEATGMYHESVLGWGADCPDLPTALLRCCKRILERAAKTPKETLCKDMDDFFKNLDDD